MDIIWHIFLVPFPMLPNIITVCPAEASGKRRLFVKFQHLTGHKVAPKSHWIYLKYASFQKFVCPVCPSWLSIPVYVSTGADFPRASVSILTDLWERIPDTVQKRCQNCKEVQKMWHVDTSTDVSLYLGRSSQSGLFCTQSYHPIVCLHIPGAQLAS